MWWRSHCRASFPTFSPATIYTALSASPSAVLGVRATAASPTPTLSSSMGFGSLWAGTVSTTPPPHAPPPLQVPANDPALALPRLAEALRSFFVLVSSPDALPEFQSVQVGCTVAAPHSTTLHFTRMDCL